MATCLDPALAGLEQQWQDLYSDFPLTPPRKDTSAYQASEELDDAILGECDKATDPAPMSPVSLHLRHRCDERETGRIHRRLHRTRRPNRGRPHRSLHRRPLSPYLRQTETCRATVTAPPTSSPSPQSAPPPSTSTPISTSTTATPARSPAGALYRKDGSFVFDDDPDNAPSTTGPVCKLAIVPDSKGVEFKDLTGGCKDYCGARGSWNGETFSFGDRVPPQGRDEATSEVASRHSVEVCARPILRYSVLHGHPDPGRPLRPSRTPHAGPPASARSHRLRPHDLEAYGVLRPHPCRPQRLGRSRPRRRSHRHHAPLGHHQARPQRHPRRAHRLHPLPRPRPPQPHHRTRQHLAHRPLPRHAHQHRSQAPPAHLRPSKPSTCSASASRPT